MFSDFPFSWDHRSAFLTVVVLPVFSICLFRAVKNLLVRFYPADKSALPTAPYCWPIIGNTIPFALNTESYLLALLKHFDLNPFGLLVAGERWYYVPHGDTILSLFKNSRDLTAKPLTTVAFRDQFGVPAKDIQIYEEDGSGVGPKPLPGFEHIDPAHRIFHLIHKDLHALLNGPSLDVMTARFVDELGRRIKTNLDIKHGTWTQFPDLYAFLQKEMFHSAIQALCGDYFFEVCPDFCDEFWAFDSHMLTYLRRTPRWLAPKAYTARERVVASMKKWRQYANDHFDWDNEELVMAEWEPVWGARLMRARVEMFRKAGQSADGDASIDLGMLWATNANVIPASLWALLDIALSPNLTSRVRAETSSCFDPATGSFDIAALCAKPLLTSIYMEALRLSVAIVVARNPVVPKFRLGKSTVERESTLISMSWFGCRDANFWNTGRELPGGKAEHPLDEFWAERFLEYPDCPESGPIRKSDPGLYAAADTGVKTAERTIEDDQNAKLVTVGIQGHWYPYGGGTKMCPGRFFAKQEMMASVAVMLHAFDIELVDPVEARKTRPDMKCFLTGALPPDRKIPVRLRRREVVG